MDRKELETPIEANPVEGSPEEARIAVRKLTGLVRVTTAFGESVEISTFAIHDTHTDLHGRMPPSTVPTP
ncbi:hypothetical protein GCM10007148_00580 [Parvularcula lutaonensis]|nr:hypothetical protein GCM10007148_00580 [Parvularcula lutaonensis]